MNKIKQYIKFSDLWYIAILVFLLCATFFFEQGIGKNYREIIIFCVIVISFISILVVKMWTRIPFHQFVFVFIVIVGSLSLMIQPILNAPDETVHLARAEAVSRGNLIVDSEVIEYDIIQSVRELQANVKKTYVESDIKGQKIDNTITQTGHVAASNISLMYIPQAIGIIVAKILHLDVIYMLWLARLFNLICYAFGVSYALKISPRLNYALFFVSVLPMSIQQAASCSPDAFINMVSILAIAYFLKLYCQEDREISWKQVVIFGCIAVLVAISKVTNIFIAGLILLIPKKNFNSPKRAILVKGLVITFAIACGALYYLYICRFPSSPQHLIYLQEANVNSSEQIKYILSNPWTWLCDFGSILINYFPTYMQSLSTFGWLEYGVSFMPMIILVLFGRICAQEKGLYINRVGKGLLFLMIVGIYAATCFAMYISWTTVGSTEIAGVQGRYFIPMIALCTVLFVPTKTISLQQSIGDIVAILGLNGVMLITTVVRYY